MSVNVAWVVPFKIPAPIRNPDVVAPVTFPNPLPLIFRVCPELWAWMEVIAPSPKEGAPD